MVPNHSLEFNGRVEGVKMPAIDPKLGLALLYAAIFVGMGVNIPFLPLWLQDRGLSPAQIGIVIGAPLLVRIVTNPLAGEAADRFGRPVLILRLTAALGVGFYLLLERAHGFWPLLVCACLAAAAIAPAIPLTDSLAVSAFRDRRSAYGPVRAWGSVAFVASTLLTGFMTGLFPAAAIIWMIIAAQGLAAMAALFFVVDAPIQHSGPVKAPPSRLLLRPAFVVAVAVSAFIQSSHAAYYALGAVHWRALGIKGPEIGVLWSVGVAAEIALFWWSSRLPAQIGPLHLFLLGAFAAVTRWTALAFDPAGWILIPLQALHAFSFAATYLGMIRAAASFAPLGLEARAQATTVTVHAMAMAAAMAAAGQIEAVAGGRVYFLMAAIAAVGGGIALACARLLRSAP